MSDPALRSLVRDDAYRVIRVLAEGPSGRTELVTLNGEGPLVRKHIPLALANAAAWAQVMDLEEPLLPHVESLYRMPDELVVVYEYVEGENLGELVGRSGPFPATVASSLLCDVCQAVGALHARGVIHRDITPGNVIVDEGIRAHLVDLGIARRHRESGSHDTTALGTWGFAAPEQFGFAQTDERSDVYSLGRLLGFMLTGVSPDSDAYDRALGTPGMVDERLAAVVERATRFEPSARYASARELAEAVLGASSAGGTRAEARPRGTRDDYRGQAPGARQGTLLDEGVGRGAAAWSEGGPVGQPSSRPLREAPPRERGAATVALTVLGGLLLLMLYTAVRETLLGGPNWSVAVQVTALGWDLGIFLLAREVYWAVTLRGPYGGVERRLALFAKRGATTFAVTFAVSLAIGIVLSAARL